MDYQDFLKRKFQVTVDSGKDIDPSLTNPKLFKFQRDIVIWAARKGKAALFLECGMGKTFIQLEWARLIDEPTIILAPLAVAGQTVREGKRFGIDVVYCREDSEVGDNKIIITNYERLDKFDLTRFNAVVLDESSILKNFTGKTRIAIINAFNRYPYKLACTATPAPNDYAELGNHAEFLNVMTTNVMLSQWFLNDTANTGNWRLKKHAHADFWKWLTSWAVCLSRPGDLGDEYDEPQFVLPSLNIHENNVGLTEETIRRTFDEGMLIPGSNPSSTDLHRVKRESLHERVARAVEIVDGLPDDAPVIIWCDTNDEADALIEAFPDAVEVRGSHTIAQKEERLSAFSNQDVRIIITKTSIAGFGLNWQHCANMIFIGVSYSFEKTYQALRRSWRFGQKNEVNAHTIFAESEGDVIHALQSKQALFTEMQQEMNEAMKEHGLFRDEDETNIDPIQETIKSGKDWTMHLGDCVDVAATLADNSIDFCVHSPPFSDLFVYSPHERDMGNSANNEEFFEHYKFLIRELFRITVPGRGVAVHCSDLPTSKWKTGNIGLYDFTGDIIRAYIDEGWIYHSRITIWKNPVVEMQRTKAHGLLHKTFTKDSTKVRVGMPDYILIFRKPGQDKPVTQNLEPGDYIGTDAPVPSEMSNYSIDTWQRYASPVWWDIDQTNVLNGRIAKANEDEKHICPLQLDVIERLIQMYTNEGDMVLSPFAGIGSEGYSAVKMGRKFIGIELKDSYFNVACRYLKEAEMLAGRVDLFTWAENQLEVNE